MTFVRDGKQAICPHVWPNGSQCSGEIYYHARDKYGDTLRCNKCRRLYAPVELEASNLVRWR